MEGVDIFAVPETLAEAVCGDVETCAGMDRRAGKGREGVNAEAEADREGLAKEAAVGAAEPEG